MKKLCRKDLQRAAKHSQNVAEIFKRKKPSSATTSTIFVASPLSSTTSEVSKKQCLENVPESGDVLHQPKKKLTHHEFRKKKKKTYSF